MANKNKIAISIIVPVYNSEKYIHECLDSIINQSFRDFECIIVNDGSSDGTRSIVEEYRSRDPRIRMISQKNEGPSSARNKGLKKAQGEHIIFLDSDDFFEESLLSDLYKKAELAADIVACNVNKYDTSKDVYIKNILSFGEYSNRCGISSTTDPKKILNLISGLVPNKLYKKSLLLDNGIKFNENLHRYEDVIFAARAAVAAQNICIVDKPLINYRIGIKTSLTSNSSKYPLAAFEAIEYMDAHLKKEGKFERLEQSFINFALENIHDALYWQEGEVTHKEIFMRLKNTFCKKYKLSSRSENYYHSEALKEFVDTVLNCNYEHFVQNRLNYLHDYVNSLVLRLEATESRRLNEQAGYESEIKALQNKINHPLVRLLLKFHVNDLIKKIKIRF